MSQAQLCAAACDGGWECEKETISKIEAGTRSLTDTELLFLLKVMGKTLSDSRPPRS